MSLTRGGENFPDCNSEENQLTLDLTEFAEEISEGYITFKKENFEKLLELFSDHAFKSGCMDTVRRFRPKLKEVLYDNPNWNN